MSLAEEDEEGRQRSEQQQRREGRGHERKRLRQGEDRTRSPSPFTKERRSWGTKVWQTFELIRHNAPSTQSSTTTAESDGEDEDGACSCPSPAVPGGATCVDETCVNYAMSTECPKGGCHPGCRNQRIQRREGVPLDVFSAGGKGYGLRLKEDVAAGQFIIEYVGEIIGPKLLAKRMAATGGGMKRLYVMQLSKNRYLDARYKGCVARFINHSCEPTARLDRWRAAGRTRTAVFSLRDLKAGEELTFDYQWEVHPSRKKTPCLCGTPSCRKFIEANEGAVPSAIANSIKGRWRVPREEDLADPRKIVGHRVRVLWEGNYMFFCAQVMDYSAAKEAYDLRYEEDGEEAEEKLQLSGGNKWEIFERCGEEESMMIAKKAGLVRSMSTGAYHGDSDEDDEFDSNRRKSRLNLLLPVAPAPIKAKGRKIMKLFVAPGREISDLMQRQREAVSRIQARTGCFVQMDVVRGVEPTAAAATAKAQYKVIRCIGTKEQVEAAIAAVGGERVNVTNLDDWLHLRMREEAKHMEAGRDDPAKLRVRKRWCMGYDWHSFCPADLEGIIKGPGNVELRNALQVLESVGDRIKAKEKQRLSRDVTLHSAVLICRYLALAHSPRLEAERKAMRKSQARLGLFEATIACIALANKALKVRAAAKPMKRGVLLSAAYSVQFPGREVEIGSEEARQWEVKLGATEVGILPMLGWDTHLANPFALYKKKRESGELTPDQYQKRCDLLLDSAEQGCLVWLKYAPMDIISANHLLAVACEKGVPGLMNLTVAWAQLQPKYQLYAQICGELAAVVLPEQSPEYAACLTLVRPDASLQAMAEDASLRLMPRGVDCAGRRGLDTTDFVSMHRGKGAGGGGSGRGSASKVVRASVSLETLQEAGLRPVTHGFRSNGHASELHDGLVDVYLQKWPSEGKKESGECGLSGSALSELTLMQDLHSATAASEGNRSVLMAFAVVHGVGSEAAAAAAASAASAAAAASSEQREDGAEAEDGSDTSAVDTELLRSNYLLVEPVPYSLQDAIRVYRKRRLPAPLLRAVARQLLNGLALVHERQVVLKGLDTEHIYVTEHETLKLGNFGSAAMCVPSSSAPKKEKESEQSAKKRKKATAKLVAKLEKEGEPSARALLSMAPELMLGSSEPTPACDLWSLGCILFVLATGKPLFIGRTRKQQLAHVFKVCGSISKTLWPAGADLPLYKQCKPVDKDGSTLRCKPRLRKVLCPEDHSLKLDADLVELLCGLLELDPAARWSAAAGLESSFVRSEQGGGGGQLRDAWRGLYSLLDGQENGSSDGVEGGRVTTEGNAAAVGGHVEQPRQGSQVEGRGNNRRDSEARRHSRSRSRSRSDSRGRRGEKHARSRSRSRTRWSTTSSSSTSRRSASPNGRRSNGSFSNSYSRR